MSCAICSSVLSEPVKEMFSLPTITSDCRLWNNGRSVTVCTGCGVMRRIMKEGNFSNIYDDYKNYPEPEGKTAKILDFVKDKIPTPETILDIGCGDGTGIGSMQNIFPMAKVYGYEPKICTERPSGKFDLITLFQVLEHVEDIHEMLEYIKSSLTYNGHALIQVPYTNQWPFDLIIADHIWHFTQKSLMHLFVKAGFRIIYISNDIIKKEITLLVDIGGLSTSTYSEKLKDSPVDWILNFKVFLDYINERVAIYGTSPAAAWIGNILGDRAVYYIDDDKSRRGKKFNGKMVYPPTFCGFPVVPSFSDCDLPAIKAKNPELRFLW